MDLPLSIAITGALPQTAGPRITVLVIAGCLVALALWASLGTPRSGEPP